uniref:RRM domain-containing protein n=1 Tax=Oreochromis aureus TaxID=47969 RepID=A0AAZ1XBJ9_OREAU
MENTQSQVLNLERVQALEIWLKATNTKLTQVNGQRKYGGPPEVWEGPTPGPRCEVFISQIPRDTYEDILIPLFSSIGPLWEFRLMMNFSGQNRGFAYAKYGSAAIAVEAIRQLHGHMVEPGYRISVRRSTEKRHLCIGGLPASTRQEGILQVLRMLVEGVERVSLKAGPGIEGVSATVAFSSHHAASMAKKVLVEGHNVSVVTSKNVDVMVQKAASGQKMKTHKPGRVAFKKQFAMCVSVKWQPTEKPNPDEPRCPQKRAKSLLPSHLGPLHHSSPQPSGPPSFLTLPASIPAGFCRAVGGPTAPQLPHPTCSFPNSSTQGHLVFAASPVMLLSKLCERAGVGQPFYEVQYSHAGPDGFLYFSYKVQICGITAAFKGLVMILPGPNASTMLEEAQKAVAQQVLQKMYNTGLTH